MDVHFGHGRVRSGGFSSANRIPPWIFGVLAGARAGLRTALRLTPAVLVLTSVSHVWPAVEPISPTADASLSGISTSDASFIYNKLIVNFYRDKDDCSGCFQGLFVRTQWTYSSRSYPYDARSWWVSGTFHSIHKLKPFDQRFDPTSSVYVEYSSTDGVNGTLRVLYTDGYADVPSWLTTNYILSKTRVISISQTPTRSGSFFFSSTAGNWENFGIWGSYSTSGSSTTETVGADMDYRDRRSITITNGPLIVQMVHQWDSDTYTDAQVTAVDSATGQVSQGTITHKCPDGRIQAFSPPAGTVTTNTFIGHAKAVSDQAWMSSALFLSPAYPSDRAFQKGHVVLNLDVANTQIQYLISKNWELLH